MNSTGCEPGLFRIGGITINLQRVLEFSPLVTGDLPGLGCESIERRLEYPMITFLESITEGRTLYRFQTAVIQL